MSIKRHSQRHTWLLVLVVGMTFLPAALFALNIDATDKYAWGENIGWLNFGTSEGDVDVSATTVDGYAWGENVGWISLTCSNTSSCGTVDYGITRSGDELSGYAWGENVGWISFACENTSSCGTVDYGVEVDSTTGIFSGYAWGENVGWIVFNCSTTSSCGTVDYKVVTSETATPTPAPPAGAVVFPPPAATPPVLPSVAPSPVVPSPAASPSPVVTTTPAESPPPAQPSTSPAPIPTSEPPEGPIPDISRAIDTIGDAVFGMFGGAASSLADACDDNLVTAGACGAAAVGTLLAVMSIVAMLVQQEIVAGAFSMLQIVGIRKRAKVWGTIYDSRTKRPIPFAKAELVDAAGRVLETRYADRDGRYGFLLSPSMLHGDEQVNISIHVTKPGYRFPTGTAISGTDFFVYDRVYSGGTITVRSDTVLNFNIPVDPISSVRSLFSGFGTSLTGPLVDRILNLGFYAGLVLVPLNLYLDPSTKNLIILAVFATANLFRLLAVHRPYGMTVDAATGKRLAFALVTLNEPGGQRVAFAVSDEYGRYILSAERNHEYELVAHTPANVAPQRETRERVTLKSGWMTRTVKVGTSAIAPIQSGQTPSVVLPVLFLLFALGFSTGRPRLPVGAVAEGVDEAYFAMHPAVASISDTLRSNGDVISLLALIATATVLAGAVIAAREAFMKWLKGRRGDSSARMNSIGTAVVVAGALLVPLSYFSSPTTGKLLVGIAFLASSGVWAHVIRLSQRP